MILQIGFAKVLEHDLPRAQLVLPTPKFGFALNAQNDDCVMLRGPLLQLRVIIVTQHESRQGMAGLHCPLRAGQVEPCKDVQFQSSLKH